MTISNKKHHLSHANELYYGEAYYGPYLSAQNRKGVLISPPTRHVIGTPVVGDANGYVETQDITAAGGLATGLNGALALAGGSDVPRALVAAWTGTAVMTVTGVDAYGEVVVESSASGTSFTGKKAFANVTAVSVSANVTDATVGTGDVLGLPFRVNNRDEMLVWENGALITAAGAFVAAVATDPATATTGDVRGTFDPAVPLNGSTRVVVEFLALDPSSKEALFGVAQYGG